MSKLFHLIREHKVLVKEKNCLCNLRYCIPSNISRFYIETTLQWNPHIAPAFVEDKNKDSISFKVSTISIHSEDDGEYFEICCFLFRL